MPTETTAMRGLSEHEDSDHSYLSTVLLPPGENAALSISAHQCVEIFAIQTFRSRAISQGTIFQVNAVLPHEV
jgi:hypothetical protein